MLLRVDTWRSEKGMHLQGFALNLTCLQNRHDHRCHLLQLLWRLGARRGPIKEIDFRSLAKNRYRALPLVLQIIKIGTIQ